MAQWLNSTFGSFDCAIFTAVHGWAEAAGGFLTPFFTVVSFFGSEGLFFIGLSLFLMFFKKSRKTGICMLISIAVGALFTNILIKNAVARPRPYDADENYRAFWEFVGASKESEYSFPSGHSTVTMTSMTALFFTANKKVSWLGFVFAILMGVSRVYLAVHYATDVIAGLIIGGVSGVISYFITKWFYGFCFRHGENRICRFVLDSSVSDIFKK